MGKVTHRSRSVYGCFYRRFPHLLELQHHLSILKAPLRRCVAHLGSSWLRRFRDIHCVRLPSIVDLKITFLNFEKTFIEDPATRYFMSAPIIHFYGEVKWHMHTSCNCGRSDETIAVLSIIFNRAYSFCCCYGEFSMVFHVRLCSLSDQFCVPFYSASWCQRVA